MIRITYLEKDSKIIKIHAEGHALFAPKGKDIVCSAVSTILIGGSNALSNSENYAIDINSGNLTIDTLTNINEFDSIVMKTMLIQLMTIEDSYKSYISISKIK